MNKYRLKFINFTSNYTVVCVIYLVASIITALTNYFNGPGSYNNYLLFKNVWTNTLKQRNIFLEYPDLFFDCNHYGVFFSMIIAPFALLPDWLGMTLWNVANTLLFLFAIYKSPFSLRGRALFAWICLQEFITASLSYQFNISLAGMLILSAIYIYEKKEVKSVICILIGFFIKIYGIVGLTQFFFVKNKTKFILWGFIISIIFFVIPMIYSSPAFVYQCYFDWAESLVKKNMSNQVLGNMQDISLMGFFRRILNNPSISNFVFLACGLPVFILPYIRISQYKNYAFQLMILSSALLFLVLFSSSSESPTYIIAVSGVAIWFVLQREKKPIHIVLLLFVIIFTCFSMSDLFPRYIKKNYIVKYSLKAVPCIVLWLRIIYELCTKDFEKSYLINEAD